MLLLQSWGWPFVVAAVALSAVYLAFGVALGYSKGRCGAAWMPWMPGS